MAKKQIVKKPADPYKQMRKEAQKEREVMREKQKILPKRL